MSKLKGQLPGGTSEGGGKYDVFSPSSQRTLNAKNRKDERLEEHDCVAPAALIPSSRCAVDHDTCLKGVCKSSARISLMWCNTKPIVKRKWLLMFLGLQGS